MLRTLPTYAHSPLVRTRDPALLKDCHTVVDVGGEYNPTTNRYDHHQRDFTATFPGRHTKLSSAGLVFLHLGKPVIAQQTGLSESSPELTQLHEKLYDDFVEAFDANDNGISAYDTAQLQDLGVSKRFNDRGFSIASVVSRFNSEHDAPAEQTEDDRFAKASSFTGSQFMSELVDAWKSWLPARKVVVGAFAARGQYDANGRILVLKEGVPWHDHLYKIEEERGISGQTLYTLFPENSEPDSKWRIRAVSKGNEGFELRKALPEPWRGQRDKELDKITGVEGGVFVHASGFIGGNKTFDGALRMAQKALDMA